MNQLFRRERIVPAAWLLLASSIIWFGFELFALIARSPEKLQVALALLSGKAVQLAGAVSLFIVFFFGLRILSRQRLIIWLVGLASVVVVGAVGAAALFATILMFFSSMILGQYLSDRAGVKQEDVFHGLIQLALGLGSYAFVISLLVLLPINYAAVYLGLLLLPIIVWPKRARATIDTIREGHRGLGIYANDSPWSFLVIALFVALYLSVALLPEMGFDALAMHLAVAANVTEWHRWDFDVTRYVWAVIPMNGDWLYTLGYMLGGEYAARLTNFSLLLALSALLALAVRRWATPSLVVLALLFLLSLPLTYLETGSLFIENALALFLFAAVLCVFLFAESRNPGYLLLAAALSGVALGTKLGAAMLLVPLLLVIIFYLAQCRSTVRVVPLVFKGLGIVLLLGAVPYVIAYVKTGNPVFPFFNAFFQSPYYDSVTSFDNPLFKQGFHWLTLRDMTFDSGKFLEGEPGAFGWVFFVLLPLTVLAALLSGTRFAAALVFVSLMFIGLVFQSQSYLRYIYPAVPLLILVMMQGIRDLGERSAHFGRAILLTGGALIVLNVAALPAASWYHRSIDFRLLYSNAARDDFLLQQVPIRKAIEFINVTEGRSARVGFFAPGLTAGLKGAPFTANWHNYQFNKAMHAIQSESQMPELLRLLQDNRIGTIILDENFNPGGGMPHLVPMLKSVTTLDRQFGHLSVRSLKQEYLWGEERLKNPDFQGLEGWSVGEGVQYQAATQSIIVTAKETATQVVQVVGNAKYQLSASVRCVRSGSMFRLQTNWHDSSNAFLGTSLIPLPCTENFEHYMQTVTSPERAVTAIIYANGHSGDDRVEFKSLSLK